ncbi:MAG: hypothetical protein EBT86_07500 [Actinobacteria bacterium]|nr:hypothetical protein [Actinomycetota bacterium]
MNNWIEIIVIAFLIFTVFYFVYRNFKIKRNFAILAQMHMQVLSDAGMLERKVKELYQEIENLKLQETDGFLKFVSDSRDWAFSYIEEVQKALAEFDEKVEPEFQWVKTFGMVLGDTAHTDILKRISEAYDKLKLVLPKNNETPNN